MKTWLGMEPLELTEYALSNESPIKEMEGIKNNSRSRSNFIIFCFVVCDDLQCTVHFD